VKRLSYFILPLLFMPNIGLGRQTVFGFLELSDFVIWPYLAVTGLAVLRHGAKRPATEVGRRLFPWVMFFLAWSLAATLTITSRYSYFTDFEMQVGLLKLAKLFVYGLAGWLTLALARRVGEGRSLLWSLVASGLVVAASLMASASGVDRGSYNTKMGYEATNSISVEAAILIVFLGGAWAMGWGSRRWRSVLSSFIFSLGLSAFSSLKTPTGPTPIRFRAGTAAFLRKSSKAACLAAELK
jgi:hypothetical protein